MAEHLGGTDIPALLRRAIAAEAAGVEAVAFDEADGLDPGALAAAVAAVTTRIGLVVALPTAGQEPYHMARRLASLAHMSGGRVAWRPVISPAEESSGRAAEFIAVVRGLWDSWQDGALLRDKAAGLYMDRKRVQFLNHAGPHFKVRGPLNITAGPDGRAPAILGG
jgi:alkanesulfonate monooxygenase SsuD/methylene tetrahydromethanopterin reductase-like flavin-dependent oxidoreductase (luciferase family)